MLLKARSVTVKYMAVSLSKGFGGLANARNSLQLFALVAVLTSLILKPIPVQATSFERGYALIGESLFEVEIASDELSREIGLSKRGKNKANYFMAFIFDPPQKVSFWMKETNLDLSIAFINDKNIIVEIHTMKAKSLKIKSSMRADIKYALEVPKGFFKMNNIRTGDFVQIFQ